MIHRPPFEQFSLEILSTNEITLMKPVDSVFFGLRGHCSRETMLLNVL